MSEAKLGKATADVEASAREELCGWHKTTLGEIAEIRSGITKGKQRGPGANLRAVPYLRVANVQRGYLDLAEVKEIEATEEEIHQYRLQPGDVLFNEGGDRDKLGRGWVWGGEIVDCIHQNHVFRARIHEDILLPKLLSWYGNSKGQAYFVAEGTQTTNLASLNSTKLRALPVLLPPRPEQYRIISELESYFTRLDDAVATLERVERNLKRYRASVLKSAVEGRLVPTEAALAKQERRSYEPASVLLERILAERRHRWSEAGKKGKYKEPALPDTNLADLPEGWCWATVDSLSTKVADGVHKKPNYVESGIPFVTVRNLTAGPGISFENLKYVTREDHNEFWKRTNPEFGDLLISKDGTLGVVRAIRTEREFSIFVSVALVKPVERSMMDYLELALSAPTVQVQMVPKGSGLQHIHLEDLRRDCIPLAPMAEQRRIVLAVQERISVIEALEASLILSLNRTHRVRQAILKWAFEGKLADQDPNDEPASVLLERINAEREAGKPTKATSPQLAAKKKQVRA